MKRLAPLVMTSGLLATIFACNSFDTTTTPDTAVQDPIGAWTLQAFQRSDGSTVSVAEPSSYTLDLGTTEAGRTHVRADCNLCNGGYELSDSALDFGLMACTLVACPPGSLERDYLAALESASTYQRNGNTLTIDYDGGRMLFDAR